MKSCSKCKIEKHEKEFRARKDRPCGLRSQCRACDLAYEHTATGQDVMRRYRQSDNGKQRRLLRVRAFQKTERVKGFVRDIVSLKKDRHLILLVTHEDAIRWRALVKTSHIKMHF